MEYLSKLSDRLKSLMFDNRQLNSEELATKVNIAGSSIRFWLRGEMLPTLESAIKIADYFECSLDYLTGKSERDEKVSPRPLPPFYENLRKIMKECGITRYYLTSKTNDFKDSHFTKWSKGSQPKLVTVCKLAYHLNVSLDYLVGRTDY